MAMIATKVNGNIQIVSTPSPISFSPVTRTFTKPKALATLNSQLAAKQTLLAQATAKVTQLNAEISALSTTITTVTAL